MAITREDFEVIEDILLVVDDSIKTSHMSNELYKVLSFISNNLKVILNEKNLNENDRECQPRFDYGFTANDIAILDCWGREKKIND